VIELTDSRSVQEFVPYEVAYGRPFEDMMRRVPSTDRIHRTVGWQPKTDLEQTLRFIIAERRRDVAAD
jgi:UDP-glucose 4-epimerase